jgi:hypothetical protein
MPGGLSGSYGVTFAIGNFRAGNFAGNIQSIITSLIFIVPKRDSRLNSTVADTTSQHENR